MISILVLLWLISFIYIEYFILINLFYNYICILMFLK